MTAADFYEVLGVARDATTEQIKKAFRRIARETHPDANPGDSAAEARFRRAAEAYEVLSNPERRRRYDRGDMLDLGDLLSGRGGIDDLLRSVFGDGGLFGARPTRPSRGRDILVTTEVTLEEAAFGTEAMVEYHTLARCASCSGTGAEPGAEQRTCPQCGGAGQVRMAQRSLFGTMMTVTDCPDCAGEGALLSAPCVVCDGAGAVPHHARVSVEVPAGVANGTRLRLSGRGESGGRTARDGDLFVEIRVRSDSRLERSEDDLVWRAELGLAEATLGTRIAVPLIEGGEEELEVPPGTQPGTVFRLRGRGMTVLGRRRRGDLAVIVSVKVPTEVGPEEEALLRRWAELRDERVDRPAPR